MTTRRPLDLLLVGPDPTAAWRGRLEQAGAVVTTAPDPDAARALLTAHHYHGVLVDAGRAAPGAPEAAVARAAATRGIPVIALTSGRAPHGCDHVHACLSSTGLDPEVLQRVLAEASQRAACEHRRALRHAVDAVLEVAPDRDTALATGLRVVTSGLDLVCAELWLRTPTGELELAACSGPAGAAAQSVGEAGAVAGPLVHAVADAGGPRHGECRVPQDLGWRGADSPAADPIPFVGVTVAAPSGGGALLALGPTRVGWRTVADAIEHLADAVATRLARPRPADQQPRPSAPADPVRPSTPPGREMHARRTQRLESIGRLAGGVAHDFNNVLTGILGFAQLLAGSFDPGDPRRDDVDQIISASQRAAALTRKLLAFSRHQPLRPEVFDLNEAVRDLHRLLARVLGEGVRVDLALGAGPLFIDAEPGEIEQVLLNLCVNAKDAMPGGGTIRIRTEEVPAGVLAPQAVARLSVADTGCGMDAETQSRIFDPFFTTKGPGEGTGLGLATVYGIVTQSQGRIAVDSTPGRGSTFVVEFPVAARPPGTGIRRRPSAGHTAAAPRTVLVAEDDAALRLLMSRALSEAGFEVLVAEDGVQAIQAARAQRRPLDAIVTDLVMPRGNGPDCVQAIRRLSPQLRVVYVTGYADAETWVRVRDDADALLLRKPFRLDDLVRAVAADGPDAPPA